MKFFMCIVSIVQKCCIFWGLVEMCEVEGVDPELYWKWIGKIMAVVC